MSISKPVYYHVVQTFALGALTRDVLKGPLGRAALEDDEEEVYRGDHGDERKHIVYRPSLPPLVEYAEEVEAERDFQDLDRHQICRFDDDKELPTCLVQSTTVRFLGIQSTYINVCPDVVNREGRLPRGEITKGDDRTTVK
jgi:hypothetical protein